MQKSSQAKETNFSENSTTFFNKIRHTAIGKKTKVEIAGKDLQTEQIFYK